MGLLLIYHILPAVYRPLLLLVFSFLLYAQEGVSALCFLAGVILLSYAGGRFLGRLQTMSKAAADSATDKEERKKRKAYFKKRQGFVLAGVLLLQLAVLFLCKFPVLPEKGRLLMPLGLSFFMFQAIGYCIDVKMGKVAPENNLWKFALFVSFFPQLIQGPIGRYKDLTPTLFAGKTPSEEDTRTGLIRIITGYIKKLVLADRLTAAVALLLADTEHGSAVALGALLYAFRLLWDFSGGIDIALGSARMLGISMTENFRAPYLSRNLEEYWTRWHISMGSWFRDYIFYPMNMRPGMLRLGVKWKSSFGSFGGRMPLYLSLLVTWFCTGLWHGNNWNYILWGLTNGIILILSEELRPGREKLHARHPGFKQSAAYAVLTTLRTFLLLCLIRLWDCYPTPGAVLSAFGRLFSSFHWNALPGLCNSLGLSAADVILLAAGLLATAVFDRSSYKNRPLSLGKAKGIVFYASVFVGILLILVFGRYGIGYDASAFIYGKF